MRNVEDFEPFVIAYAPYVPSEILQHAIRESISDFMRETKIAIAQMELETQDKVLDYILEPPDCRRIVKVKSVEISQLHCSGKENWTSLRTGDFGDYQIELRKGVHPIIVLRDPPKKPHRLRIEYVWTISRDDCEIPEFIYEDFMTGIVAGAVLRLALLPENEALLRQLDVHRQTWFNAIQSAKIERSGGRAKQLIGAPLLRRRGRSLWR